MSDVAVIRDQDIVDLLTQILGRSSSTIVPMSNYGFVDVSPLIMKILTSWEDISILTRELQKFEVYDLKSNQ